MRTEIIIILVAIIIIGTPIALNQYDEWQHRQEVQREIQEAYRNWQFTVRSTPPPTPTPVSTPAPAVKNGIFGGWWCYKSPVNLVTCYQFSPDGIVYESTNMMPSPPTRYKWWINAKGYYQTDKPTFIYRGNTMQTTLGEIYHWCPYPATMMAVECLD